MTDQAARSAPRPKHPKDMARKSAVPTAAKPAVALAAAALLLAAAHPAAASPLGFVPPAASGCPPNVNVNLDAVSRPGGWLSGGPSVSGRATVLNGETFSVPVSNVEIMIFPANSPVAPVYAECVGIGSGQRVPSSPIPFQYGRASCSFQANLPTNGPSAGARNWQQARAVVTLTNGAKCYSDMTGIATMGGGGGGGWPWGSSGGGIGGAVIGGANPSSGSGGGMIGGARPGGMGSGGMGSGMGSGGMGMGSGMGSGGMGMGGGMGSGRMVGGAKPPSSSSSSSGSSGAPMMLGGANPTTKSSGGGGRKLLSA